MLDHIAAGRVQDKVALRIQTHLIRSTECKPDAGWVSSRRHHEVVLKLSLMAVKGQVDSRVHGLVCDAAERRHIHTPLGRITADEVIDGAWQPVLTRVFRRRVAPNELHPYHGGCGKLCTGV